MKRACFSALLLTLCLVTACNRDPNVAKQKYLENGNKYFERGKYKQAYIMYSNALKRDGRFGEAYYRRALAELEMQRWSEAVADLRRSIELQPKNLEAHTRLTNLYLNVYMADRRRPEPLLNQLKEMLRRYQERFPGSYEEARLAGYLAVFEGDTEKALEQFAKAHAIKPAEEDLVLMYMQTLFARNRAEEAEKLGREMLGAKPNALRIYDVLYLHYMRSGRVQDGQQILQAKLEKNPKEPRAYLQLAAHHHSRNEPEQMNALLSNLKSNTKDFPEGPLMVGEFFQRTGDLNRAAANFREGLDKGGKNKQLYQKKMIEVLVRQQKRDEASKLVAEMLKDNPDDQEAISTRAALSLLGGTPAEVDSAIKDIQTVISKMPQNAALRFNLARALLAKGDVKAARVQIDEAIKLQPNYLAPRFLLTQMHLSRREFGEALNQTEEVLKLQPDNLAALLYRAQAVAGTGDTARARQELSELLKKSPNLVEAKLQLAALDLRSNDAKGAEGSFRSLFAQTQDLRAFSGLIQSLVVQGRMDQAKSMLRQELEKQPDQLQLRMMLANLALASRDPQGAAAEYRKVVEKAPKAVEAWVRLGDAQRLMGDTNGAIASFKKAQEVAPSSAAGYLQLALLYETSGQKQDAMPLYEKTLELQPDNPIALNNLAYMLAESGSNLDRAMTLAQRARQQVPNDSNIADTLGYVYVKKNLHDSAIALFRELIEKEPERSTYRLHLAEALVKKGDKVQARKELETALRSNPPKQEETRIRELMASIS